MKLSRHAHLACGCIVGVTASTEPGDELLCQRHGRQRVIRTGASATILGGSA